MPATRGPGGRCPRDLLERLVAAKNFDMGFATVEYVASALVDLDFHSGPPPADPLAAEAATLERIGMPRAIALRHATPHFAHVFSGDGYSAGYYSYMWSEVMDADAFAAFEETGDVFDPGTAARLSRARLCGRRLGRGGRALRRLPRAPARRRGPVGPARPGGHGLSRTAGGPGGRLDGGGRSEVLPRRRRTCARVRMG